MDILVEITVRALAGALDEDKAVTKEMSFSVPAILHRGEYVAVLPNMDGTLRAVIKSAAMTAVQAEVNRIGDLSEPFE